MEQYLAFLKHILTKGQQREDRTGTGTLSVFGYQMRFDLSMGFPLVTTKKLHIRSIIYELLWFLKGDTNIQYLRDNRVTIWDEWADANGDLGPIYGKQWRAWQGPENKVIDQMAELLKQLQTNPNSRRLIINSWNVADLPKMALPPCHVMMQFHVDQGKLSCMLIQRSADAFLGVPFNIASYSLLTHMLAQQCDLQVGDFIWSGGDCHIYLNHIEQVKTQLSRTPYSLPQLHIIRKPNSLFEYQFEDFEFINYQCHEAIKAPIAV
jgi:thymidylate synthase